MLSTQSHHPQRKHEDIAKDVNPHSDYPIETSTYHIQMRDAFDAYKNAISETAEPQTMLSINLTTQLSLQQIYNEYQSLPLSVSNVLNEEKDNYLQLLFADEKSQRELLEKNNLGHVDGIKKKYVLTANQFTISESILLPYKSHFDAALEIAEQSKQESRSIEERHNLLTSALQQYNELMTLLEKKAHALKLDQETAAERLAVKNYFSNNVYIDIPLQKELDGIYLEVINKFEHCITTIYQEMRNITRIIKNLHILQSNIETQQLLSQLIDGADNLNAIQKKITHTEIQISSKKSQINRLKDMIDLLSKTSLCLSEEINYEEKLAADTQMVIDSHEAFIASKLTLIENTKTRDNLLALESELSKANAEFSTLKQSWFKNDKQTQRFKMLPAEIDQLTKTIAIKNENIRQLELACNTRNILLRKDREDLRNVQQYLNYRRIIAAQTSVCLSNKNEQLNACQFDLDNLEKFLCQLQCAAAILQLNSQLMTANMIEQQAKEKEPQLLEALSDISLSPVINAYNEASRLDMESSFPTFMSLLTHIKQAMSDTLLKDDFYAAISQMIANKEEKITGITRTLNEISKRLCEQANKTAQAMNLKFTHLVQMAEKKFKTEVENYVSHFHSNHSRITKHIHRLWFSYDDIMNMLHKPYECIIKNKTKIKSFYDTLTMQLALVEQMIDKSKLLSQINLCELQRLAESIQNKYIDAEQKLSAAGNSINLDLIDLTKLSTIKDRFDKLLDDYEKNRSAKYWLKDFFCSSDKVKRHAYIKQLKKALHEFSYLDLSKDSLMTIIQKGIDTFPTGVLSNTNNPEKNLKGILTLLKNELNLPKTPAPDISFSPLQCKM